MAQATPNRPPRPLTGGQVSALLRAIRGRATNDALEATAPPFDSIDVYNIELLVMEAAKDVNNDIQRGVSS